MSYMSYQPVTSLQRRIGEGVVRALFWALALGTNLTPIFPGGMAPAAATTVDLGVAIQKDSVLPIVNEVMNYTVTITNRGPNTATGVVVSNQLPAGSLLVSAVASHGTHNTGQGDLTWSVGTLMSGGTASIQFQLLLPLLGEAVLVSRAIAAETDLNPEDNSAISTATTILGDIPQILTPPENKDAVLGLPVSLDVVAASVLPLRYQWRRNGMNVPGATNSTLSFPLFSQEQAGSYSVLVINEAGVVVSDPAELRPLLTIGLPFEDQFVERRTVTGVNVVGLGSNLTASIETGEPQHAGKVVGKTLWLSWRPLLGGIAKIRTLGSTFDTVVAVYTGESLSTLVPVAADDDGGGFGTSAVAFNAVAGTEYHIAIAGYNGAAGLISLILNCEITGQRLPVITTHPEGKTVPPGNDVVLSVEASGTDLGYQWFRDGVALADASGPQLLIPAVGQRQVGVYHVKVTSGSRSVLSKSASLQLFIPGPGEVFQDVRAEDKLTDLLRSIFGTLLPNDGSLIVDGIARSPSALSTSKPVKSSKYPPGGARPGIQSTARGYTGTHIFSTYGSSSQAGEPNHCDHPGGASEWVGYEAPEGGLLVLDTAGSNFDTILAVYTGSGSSFESLQPVACDDNGGSDGETSRVTFNVEAGTTYFIAIDGMNGQWGTVVLNYNLLQSPTITLQPTDCIVDPGSSVSLQIAVSGRPAPQLQWILNGQVLASATNTTLTLDDIAAADEGAYQLLAQNPAGEAASTLASVLISAPLKLQSMGLDSSKMARFRLVGVHSRTYLVQASTNLTNWTTIATNYTDTGIISFLDCAATNHACRFYRAVPVE